MRRYVLIRMIILCSPLFVLFVPITIFSSLSCVRKGKKAVVLKTKNLAMNKIHVVFAYIEHRYNELL